MAKRKKVRTEFRKNRGARVRRDDWTKRFASQDARIEDEALVERVSGKGELTRKRTLVAEDGDGDETVSADETGSSRGRVLSVRGLISDVQGPDGRVFQCATRRLLKTIQSDERHVVAVGDIVRFRPADNNEGMIERIEPRTGVLSRSSKGRRHIIVANVDQIIIVTSAAEPTLKPNLVDRYLVSAEQNHIRPVICINKVDLIDLADLQPIVGVYSQMGYQVLQVSAATGFGMENLRRALRCRASVFSGQSGVGKSSLLNAVEPGFGLKVQTVSEESQKGRHTTTNAWLLPLESGGYVVDTPGIRQFQLWDIIPAEVGGLFRDLRPFANKCRFPDCTHTHEDDCAVKDAVADGYLDARRYESYCHIFLGD
jgi:ribosome biogenesis GTPase